MKNSFLRIFQSLLSFLPADMKKKIPLLFTGILLVAVFEILTLGAIALFASAIASPEALYDSGIFKIIERFPARLLPEGPVQLILFLSIGVALLVLCKNVLLAWSKYGKSRFTALNESFFGIRLLDTILSLPYSEYITYNPSELTNLVSWRIHIGAFVRGVLLFISDGIVVAALIVSLFVFQPLVSTIVLVILGLIGYLSYSVVRKRIDRAASIERDINADCFVEASAIIYGLKDIKINRKELFFLGRYRKAFGKFVQINSKHHTYQEASSWLLETAGFFAIALTIVIMLALLDAEPKTVFPMVALLSVTAWRVLPAVNRIIKSATHLRVVLPYISRLLGYLNLHRGPAGTPFPEENQGEGSRSRTTKRVSLRNVSFTYPGQKEPALREISFSMEPGGMYAVIGKSGAGKSTLADVLAGLQRPDSGSIEPEGRYGVGYVHQHPYLFDGTVTENIAFGVPEDQIDYNRIEICSEIAALDFIVSLPLGLDTHIGERGIRLSGGQRQRLALARALYPDPEIIIFDEATNALDEGTEEKIYNSLSRIREGKIIIIIAHRPSSLDPFTAVIRLDRGRIRKME